MTSTRCPDDALVLQYVTSDLAELEQAAFEEHLFTCDVCLARVERLQAAQAVLASRELPDGPTSVRSQQPPAPAARLTWWMLAVAALIIVAVAAGFAARRGRGTEEARLATDAQSGPLPDGRSSSRPLAASRAAMSGEGTSVGLRLAVLAMVTPPRQPMLPTPGAANEAQFAAAMAAYAMQDWAGAARALRAVDTPAARFYQGVADLMRGDAAGATTSLDAARASGVSPYASESAFYLGKAALQRGDVVAARTWFATARAAEGVTSKEAARLLAALDELEELDGR